MIAEVAPNHRPAPTVDPRPQLVTYPDSLGGSLAEVADLLDGPLLGLFRGVHVLPPFPSSGDRGFAPMTYDEIDPRFGGWEDIRRISQRHDVLIDLMINHISRRSLEFQDFLDRGRSSPCADLFVTLDKVWQNGEPTDDDVARIFLRKPDGPFSTVTIRSTGAQERVWTSFGSRDWSEQIDLDVTSSATRELITGWLAALTGRGVGIVRLDAVGYVIKKAGTTCFMVEPEIYEFLDWVTGIAGDLGLVVLPEVHDGYTTHRRLSAHGYWTYDFVLPGLLLHSFRTGEVTRLARHLAESPDRQFTNLDCHDGIPVRPDLDGILSPDEMRELASEVRRQGGNVNRILSNAHASGVDIHQLNCTYYSALGCDDGRYIAARAIQLFAKGVPQIYYVGLLAGENDHDAARATGEGRAINRHDYSVQEVQSALQRPVVQRVIDLVRLRNEHPAFEGEFFVAPSVGDTLQVTWHRDSVSLGLVVDFSEGRASLIEGDERIVIAAWSPVAEQSRTDARVPT